ncbi:MAG: prepilin-type N-terminal cleavage/methylation domain-containing protein [Planctomycetia bacterium]|nr:prepilin-type N-terminal cleavage/methylation domain-containing protein [Planctomycetia bacterium]
MSAHRTMGQRTVPGRRGFTLLEVLAACMLLAVLLVVATKVTSQVVSAQRMDEQQTWALHEADIAMERLASLNWNDLTPQRVAAEQLSTSAQKVLGGGRLITAIDAVPGDPTAKRLRVEVQWRDSAGQSHTTRPLTAWKYRVGLQSQQ